MAEINYSPSSPSDPIAGQTVTLTAVLGIEGRGERYRYVWTLCRRLVV